MRNTVIKVGLFLCALILLSTQQVGAISSKKPSLEADPFHLMDGKILAFGNQVAIEEDATKKPGRETKNAKPSETTVAPLPQPLQYAVLPGDSLTKIAEAHQTQWTRIFAKNIQIANPDILNVGDTITIPEPEEQLTERAIPIPEPVLTIPTSSTSQVSNAAPASTVVNQTRGSSAGNTYYAGYCTWYVKSRRPDLPNRLGNASSWVASAAAQGFATGNAPQAGAIGQQGNHVVYVESVNGDGTVTVSEMNYKGLYVVSSRTVSASSFTYIY